MKDTDPFDKAIEAILERIAAPDTDAALIPELSKALERTSAAQIASFSQNPPTPPSNNPLAKGVISPSICPTHGRILDEEESTPNADKEYLVCSVHGCGYRKLWRQRLRADHYSMEPPYIEMDWT